MPKTRSGKIVLWGSLWGMGILILALILEPTPENITLAVSITLSGIYTWLLYLTKDLWIKKWIGKPIRNAILLGSINAAVIETLFLLVEKTFGASGVAAHPNLMIDLLITMPWYISLVWAFVHIQKSHRFSPAIVLLLGAVYEMGADGIIGGLVMPGLMGNPVHLLEFLILSAVGAFWQFIPVYSSIVLPPTWILDHTDPPLDPTKKHWSRALLPLLILIPFSIYLVLVMGVISSTGG